MDNGIVTAMYILQETNYQSCAIYCIPTGYITSIIKSPLPAVHISLLSL